MSYISIDIYTLFSNWNELLQIIKIPLVTIMYLFTSKMSIHFFLYIKPSGIQRSHWVSTKSDSSRVGPLRR